MKKILAMLLMVAVIFSVTACGAAPAPQTTAAPAANDAQTNSPDSNGEPVYINANAADMKGTVRFYTAFNGDAGTDALIAEFNQYYPQINVEYTTFKNNSDGNVGLDAAIMAGEVDVVLSFTLEHTADRWTNGMLMDLTDRLAADNLDLKKEWGTDVYKYNDRVYAFPSGGLPYYVAINMDKWNAAGLGELPTEWTFDEYIKACEAMTEKDASGNVTVYGGTEHHSVDNWVYSIRQSKGFNAFYKEDGTSDFDNPLWATVLQRELDTENAGIWYPKANYIADGTKSRDKFLSGEAASDIDCALVRYIVSAESHDFKVGFAPYPTNVAGETNYMAGATPYSFIGVCVNAQDQEAAYAFAKFCATYGNKYMFCASHAARWSGVDTDEVVDVVFGSAENAETMIDVNSFVDVIIAAGKQGYTEDNIVAYSQIQALITEYSKYVFSGEMTVEEAMANLKSLADEAIQNAQ